MASKKQDFINYVNSKIVDFSEAPQSVQDYWLVFSTAVSEAEKPPITEKGAAALKHIRECGLSMFKSRDIAEGMGVASRSISGTMTKLAADGFLEKISDSPAIYSLTEKGKTFEI